MSETDYDRSIHTNTDQYAWADFFLKTFPNCGVDRDTIAGWFANAMMAMYDSLKKHDELKEVKELLDRACTGIEWYRDAAPDLFSEADEEFLTEAKEYLWYESKEGVG